MTLRSSVAVGLAMMLGATGLAGCSRNSPTEPWPAIIDPIVFTDTFGSHVGFQAFGNSKLDALSLDTAEKHSGTTSLKFTVPNPGDPSGGYAGGAFVASQARSFTSYNALSFWVKASRAVILETAGLGNDNTGTSKYDAKRSNIPVTTDWSQVLIPIPLPARLTAEKGLFYLAEGPKNGTGLTLWVDDVQFVNDPSITNPRPLLTTQALTALVGSTLDLAGTTATTFAIGATDQTVTHMPGYFTYASSDLGVAGITNNIVRVLGEGSATVSAKLGAVDATGSVTVTAALPPISPAPTPSVPTADVISLFSNAYPNIGVDSWSKFGSAGITVEDFSIAGNAAKLYKKLNLGYVGVEFKTNEVDATTMTTFHMDVWASSGSLIRVKLVDFGADGIFGGGNDTQHELTFNASSTPAFAPGAWVSLELPLDSFTGLTGRAHIAQLILSSSDTPIVLVDNVYFHK